MPHACTLELEWFVKATEKNTWIFLFKRYRGYGVGFIAIFPSSYTHGQDELGERYWSPVRRRQTERHKPALVRQRAAWTDGVLTLGYQDAMHLIPLREKGMDRLLALEQARRYAGCT